MRAPAAVMLCISLGLLAGCAGEGTADQSIPTSRFTEPAAKVEITVPGSDLPYVYVVAVGDGYRVLSPVDPHHPDRADCLIEWHPDEQVFRDPCFGQTYDLSGAKISGPGGHAGMDIVTSEAADGVLHIWLETSPWAP